MATFYKLFFGCTLSALGVFGFAKYGYCLSETWAVTYDGPEDLSDEGTSVALGVDGSVFITGHVSVEDQVHDIFVAKYSAIGQLLWTEYRRF